MPRRTAPIAFALLLLTLVVVISFDSDDPDDPSPVDRTDTIAVPRAFDVIRDRLAEAPSSPARLVKIEKLAVERSAQMREWIVTDPERALRESISWSEFKRLPESLRPHFERPFNTTASLRVLPVCGENLADRPTCLLEIDDEHWDAHVFGRRTGQMTKENAPLSGITLGAVAAVREFPFEALDGTDAATLADLPMGNPDAGRDFSTGHPLPGTPVTAVAGGRRYLFSDRESLAAFNSRLATFDDAPGPHAGAQVYLADGVADGADGFDWEVAGDIVQNAASDWTETVKDVFYIRVDFSDVPGEVVSQASLSDTLNNAVSDSIFAMSYEKTSINATVSATTVRLPQPSTFYLPADNTSLHNHAIAAYDTLNSTNIAGSYDIIGVHFPFIGITSGTLTYAGLAGGSRQWLQGTTSSKVIVHEFGHNYGLGHASFWDTSDGSVVGTGTHSEYGDVFDIMGSGPNPEGHFHMQAKSRLNWLEDSQWVDTSVTGSGIYRIHRFDDAATTGALRGLRAAKGVSPGEYYWLGYRAGIENNAWLQSGAYMLWQQPGSNNAWLADATPDSRAGSADKNDGAVALGRTYSDSTASLHFTPTRLGGGGADSWIDINVQIGPFPGNVAPTATLAIPSTMPARTATVLSVSASDSNSDPLAYSWDFGDGTPSVNSASVNHAWLVGGTYTVSVIVTDMKGGAVTKSTTVTVTDILETWTAGNVGVSNTMNEVGYFNGRFFATGDQNVYHSFDGANWEANFIATNYKGRGLASDGSSYVTAGYDWNGNEFIGAIFRSDDGRLWETVGALPLAERLRDVCAGAGSYIAVGDTGAILQSTDEGESWTQRIGAGAWDFESVTYGGGVFVLVGEDKVYTSTSGSSWTDRSSGHSLASWHTLKDVHYANGNFYAGGWYSGIIYSSDGGISWTDATMPDGTNYDIESITDGAGLLIAVATNVSTGDGVLLVSADGMAWAESNVAAFPDTETVTFGGGRFLTVHGSTGATYYSAPLFPTNAAPAVSINAPLTGSPRQLTAFSSTAGDADGDPLTLVWDFGSGFALIEDDSALYASPVGGSITVTLTATDSRGGVTVAAHTMTIDDPLEDWTQRTSGTSAILRDIAFGNGTLVAVGDSGTYRTSGDAVTWTGGSIGPNIGLSGIIHDGTQFVAAGWDYNFGLASWSGTIFTSPDASAWTRRHFAGEELNDVAHGNGVYVAAGDFGTLFRSTDGTTWTAVPTGVTEDLLGVSFGNGVFVTVGAGSTGGPTVVLTSVDGLSWDNDSGGAGNDSWQGFYDVEFLNGRFLASGWYSKLRHSTDNGATFSTNRTTTEQIPAFAFGKEIYFAAGIDKSHADADINLVSTDGETWNALATQDQDDRRGAIYYDDTFITVGDNGAIWQSGVFGYPSPATGFAAWRSAYFPGLPAGSGANEDFDADGVKNLAEYATGTDPVNPRSRIPVFPVIVNNYLTLTIPKAPVDDIDFAIHRSTDLIHWGTAGTVTTAWTPELMTVRSADDIDTVPEVFLRPVFTLTP